MKTTQTGLSTAAASFIHQQTTNAVYSQLVAEMEAPAEFSETWATSVKVTPEIMKLLPGKPASATIHKWETLTLFKIDDLHFYTLTVATNNNLSLLLTVPVEEIEGGRELIKDIQRILPVDNPEPQQKIRFGFWTNTKSRGPTRLSRAIAAHQWEEIQDNYPGQVGKQLNELMTMKRPASGGQLVLWNGEPGTGKTNAIRALAWEWRKWCSCEYITDPERFFGDSSYLLDVVINNEVDEDFEEEGPDVAPGSETSLPWRLFILEDTGELLQPDAKSSVGQGLSRLLNLLDGLIGQGLRVLVLITTNEELGQIHPAVARPGRCASKVEFLEFKTPEANTWLAAKGKKSPNIKEASTLAELYLSLTEKAPAIKQARVGFNR